MTAPGPTPPGCGAHASLGAELRAVAALALDRLGPVLERAREGGPGTPSSCSGCPVCAVLALLRGERPELAVRLAEHAAGLLAVLHAALDERDGRPAGGGPAQDGAAQDGAAQDGAAQDGAAQDGAAQDGAAQDGAAQDRAAQDGAARPAPQARRVQRIPVDRPAAAAR